MQLQDYGKLEFSVFLQVENCERYHNRLYQAGSSSEK